MGPLTSTNTEPLLEYQRQVWLWSSPLYGQGPGRRRPMLADSGYPRRADRRPFHKVWALVIVEVGRAAFVQPPLPTKRYGPGS